MARRRGVNAGADQRYFSKTANKTKALNLGHIIPRGGIRL